MRVLWVGDSPTVATGFAACTRAVCSALHAAGHEVAVLGINEMGDPNDVPYDIYPCRQPFDGGFDPFGVSRLPVLAARLCPDVIVILQDPWNIKDYVDNLAREYKERELGAPPPVIGWIAVDARNQRGDELNGLAHVVTWTRFAIDELRRGGYVGTSSIVPLGVDRSVFRPLPMAECRRNVLPEQMRDSFIVGVVNRNQPRKRLDLALDFFAAWIHGAGISDAYLYMHVAPTGDRGYDIPSIARYLGLKGRVVLAEPDIGKGIAGQFMPIVYGAFDACLSTTQGEGWGLTTMEAMACGVPCIVPDFAALGEWPEDAALKVACSGPAISAPMNVKSYAIGAVPDRVATVHALDTLYADHDLRATLRHRGLELTARPEYQWVAVGQAMREVIESVARETIAKEVAS